MRKPCNGHRRGSFELSPPLSYNWRLMWSYYAANESVNIPPQDSLMRLELFVIGESRWRNPYRQPHRFKRDLAHIMLRDSAHAIACRLPQTVANSVSTPHLCHTGLKHEVEEPSA